MNKNIQYILVVFVLFLGFQVQAQNTITAYETKRSSLSNVESIQLNSLINGASTFIAITDQNQAEIYKGNTNTVSTMKVTQSSDFAKLAQSFEDKLAEIKVLSIDWNGQEEIVLPTALLNRMSNLKYIYIRSYEIVNPIIIQNKFSSLLNQLDENTQVEVLFYTMEKPS